MAAIDRQDGEHLLGMIETLQAGNATLADRVKAVEDEAACVLTRLAKVENQLDRFRAEEFWDRVMREVAEVLPELRNWTVRGEALHREPLTAAVPRKETDVRVSLGRYFERRDEGRYSRRVARWRRPRSSPSHRH